MIGTLPLYDAQEMRELDRLAVERLRIPGMVLMERAGVAAAHEILQRYAEAEPVVVVCGAGNNGGDGFVVARHLHAAGTKVSAHLVGPASRLPADARANLEICGRLGVEVVRRPPPARLRRALRGAGLIVDAVFGTGFQGAPRAEAAAVIDAVNASPAPVVALDVPSGVDGSSGVVAGAAVRADLTVVFHGAKVGLMVSPGRALAGAVVVADIGIPPQLESGTAVRLATLGLLGSVPAKDASSTKYSAGSVLVVGGAPGMSGAPALAGLAALRAGAGTAWVAVAPEVVGIVAAHRAELMVRPLPGGLELAERAGAVALGPGLGRSPDALAMARRLARTHRGPMVIDADALQAFAGELGLLARRRVPAVLTPHEGEMARLLGVEAGWVRSNRLEAVRRAAAQSRAVVLLKGDDTLIAAPGGERVVVSVAEAPGLATAGSGDVLTGTVAAMLSKGLEPMLAAACGAVAHARSGRLASAAHGRSGIVAGEVIDALPEALG
jgi:ADP-dependent NAD(P)H-hydrate dehydratase / NAD(P)H-hydrate epimerase